MGMVIDDLKSKRPWLSVFLPSILACVGAVGLDLCLYLSTLVFGCVGGSLSTSAPALTGQPLQYCLDPPFRGPAMAAIYCPQ